MALRFLAWVAGWSVLLWALLATATVLLDPLGLRARTTDGPARRQHTCAPMEAWKMPAFERSGARTIFLGTSRVALGMDATAAGALGAPGPAFNLALPGPGLPEVARLAAQLISRGSADVILLGLDFGMFTGATDLDRGLAAGRGGVKDGVSAWIGGLPSRVEMRQVLNVACRPYEFDPRTGTVWWQESSEIAFENALHLQLATHVRCQAGACAAGYRASIEALRALVRDASRSNVRLVAYINPLPSPYLEAIRASGAGPQFERWKRDIAAIVQEGGGARMAPVRDFAVYAAETQASRPTAPAASESVVGFLDVSHYTIGLGRIMQRHLALAPGDAHFGAPLRLEGIERHFQRDRSERDAWAAQRPRPSPGVRSPAPHRPIGHSPGTPP